MTDNDDGPGVAAPAAMSTVAAEAPASAVTVPDSPAAATPATACGVGEPTTAVAIALSTLQGSTAERIDQLHREMFAGSALGHHTELWNLVASFKERVKALVAAEA
ncbi:MULTISPECIES: hypothetical protein [Methylobacterium]|uniref:hypothetical protein n=1 Tax=Methylobacterium TaxID=407 RepID=UPI0013EC904A|nr:hypothetical protein [Methylobacterium sp. DB0501]NGM34518.1 hypothetical protein [Methylobacterium sp. DB0501]